MATAAHANMGSCLPAAQNALTAQMIYVQRPTHGEPPMYDMRPGVPQEKRGNVDKVQVTVPFSDLRGLQQQPVLEKHGFERVSFIPPEGIDWADKEQVKNVYYPAVAQLLKQYTGATRVHVFDHTMRQGHLTGTDKDMSDDAQANAGQDSRKPPAATAHVDFDSISGVKRLHLVLPEEAERLSKTPFAIVQVWHSLGRPDHAAPLAFIDAQSVGPDDLMSVQIQFPDRVGHVQAVTYSPDQRWFFNKNMQRDEAWLWYGYDSRGRVKFVPHSAFKDPTAPADAPPRESSEVRAYVFWEAK